MNILLLTSEVIQENTDIFAEILTWLEGLGGINNVILGSAGVTIFAVAVKILELVKYFRSAGFSGTLLTNAETMLTKVVEDPKTLNKIAEQLSKIQTIQQIGTQSQSLSQEIKLELEGRVFDIEAKIKSGLFVGEELEKLLDYKARLIEYVETHK